MMNAITECGRRICARVRVAAAHCLLPLLLVLSEARAVEPDEMLADPALEMRARDVSRDIRCLVCQSQTIGDSDAPLAKDLRLIVRERIVAGDSDEDVRDFIVERYGEFVLLKPRLSAATVVLWSAPAILLAAAGISAVLALRGRRSAPMPLTPDEEARLQGMTE